MRLIETILGMGGEGIKEKKEELNSTMINYKENCTCRNVPPVQQ
jgi:hypothetical protein